MGLSILSEVILIDDYIVSRELFQEHFLCDYAVCRGACCIEGESGAPITAEEEETMWRLLPAVKPLLNKEARAVIRREGIAYTDISGERVTALVGGRQCVFATFTEEGACLCSFEKKYRAGEIDFPKPISCHLYPIRIHRYPHAIALNYDEWDICRPAVRLGRSKGIPVYRALKEPLIRAFGEEFFSRLKAAEALLKEAAEKDIH